MRTAMTEALGLRFPIAQAPMGRSVPPEMAAAVANAGGLGMLGASWDSLSTIERNLSIISSLTSENIALNFGLEFDQRERISFALKNGVKFISLFGGDPMPFADEIKSAGAKLIVTVGDVDAAKHAVKAGADVICAQNWEAGGHIYSDIGGLSLTPSIVDVADGVPVVVAGGISDGRGLAAALALGADGVWLGTRFLLTKESAAHHEYKKTLLAAQAQDTVKTDLFDLTWPDAPHRVIKNSTYRNWAAAGMLSGSERPGSNDVIVQRGDADLHRYSESAPLNGMTGDIKAMALYAGQSVGAIHELSSVEDVMEELMAGAQKALHRLSRSPEN
jgi:nitronate monooxygenase